MARHVEKPWGFENIWAETERYVGKVLHIRAGKRLSLQFHQRKDESILVLNGKLRLELEDERGQIQVSELEAGQSRRIPTGRKHRFGAIEDCDLVEVSTPELDDVVRVQDDYGRVGS